MIPEALALSAVLPQGPSAGALIKDLQHKDPRVRIAACEAVAKSPSTDARVIKAVLAAKEHTTMPQSAFETVHHHAVRALEACGVAGVPVLIDGLADRQLRTRAAGVLGTLRPVDPRALPALRKCLAANAADTAGSCAVVIAIGALGAHGHARGIPAPAGLGERQRQPYLPRGDAGQDLSLLGGGASQQQEHTAEHHGRQIRAGEEHSPHLLEHHD